MRYTVEGHTPYIRDKVQHKTYNTQSDDFPHIICDLLNEKENTIKILENANIENDITIDECKSLLKRMEYSLKGKHVTCDDCVSCTTHDGYSYCEHYNDYIENEADKVNICYNFEEE